MGKYEKNGCKFFLVCYNEKQKMYIRGKRGYI